MTTRKTKAPSKSGNSAEGIDRNPTKGTIMNKSTSRPSLRAKDWNGHTDPVSDLDMQALCNGDQHAAGGGLNRANHLIPTAA